MDLFHQGRLEVTFRHSEHVVSRMRVIAPNVATARGYSGWVFIDEIGFIKDFRALFGEMEPIISRDPTFHLIMATTPPMDDAHFSYDLAAPPPGMEFEPDPCGHTYMSQLNVPVHRVDAWDARPPASTLRHGQRAQISPEIQQAVFRPRCLGPVLRPSVHRRRHRRKPALAPFAAQNWDSCRLHRGRARPSVGWAPP
jgi:hypothetical protein